MPDARGFRPKADHLWHVASPGAVGLDFAHMPYTKRDPDYFPRIDDPWAVRGRPKVELFRRAEETAD